MSFSTAVLLGFIKVKNMSSFAFIFLVKLPDPPFVVVLLHNGGNETIKVKLIEGNLEDIVGNQTKKVPVVQSYLSLADIFLYIDVVICVLRYVFHLCTPSHFNPSHCLELIVNSALLWTNKTSFVNNFQQTFEFNKDFG